MYRTITWYKYINILSIDVALGAIVSSFFLANIFNIEVGNIELISLGTTVWLIYSIDHLIDAKRIQAVATTRRHRFHQHHFTGILISCVLVMILQVFLLFQIDQTVLVNGIWLGLVVVLYFLVQNQLGALKEPIGAILYLSGVCLPLLQTQQDLLRIVFSLPALSLLLTAFSNLVLFSLYDRENDIYDCQKSVATQFGYSTTVTILVGLFALQSFLLVVMVLNGVEYKFIALLFAMNLLLCLIFLFKSWFVINDRYRFYGDLIFIIPVLSIL